MDMFLRLFSLPAEHADLHNLAHQMIEMIETGMTTFSNQHYFLKLKNAWNTSTLRIFFKGTGREVELFKSVNGMCMAVTAFSITSSFNILCLTIE